MTRTTRAAAALAALVTGAAVLVPVAGAEAAPVDGATARSASGARLPDRPVTRLIVRMKDGVAATTAVRSATARLAGVGSVGSVRRLTHGATLLDLGTPLSAVEARKVADALAARTDVDYAEPDTWFYPTTVSDIPNSSDDPRLSSQWDLWDTAAAAGGFGTRAPAVWSRTLGRPSVVVAVLDTGLTAHQDITSSVTSPAASDPVVRGYDFVTDSRTANDGTGRDSNPSDPGDWITPAESGSGFFQGCPVDTSSWHGTHVTGTIVAKRDNGVGVSGIAPGVKVQPVRALGKCGGELSDIIDAMTWAAGGTVAGVPANPTPASVINLSLGGDGACSPSMQAAITFARGQGATVVVAAGNSGRSIAPTSPRDLVNGAQPADCQGVVSVAASDRAGDLTPYSNFGTAAFPITITAPGGAASASDAQRIWSTVNTGTTTPVSSGYAAYSGTSMATPHVSAAAALLQSTAVGRTPYTPDQVATLLRSLTQPVTGGCSAVRCGSGILDLSAGLPTFAPLAPTVHGEAATASVDLTWTPGDGGGLPVTYTVEQSEDGGPFHATSPALTGLAATSAVVTGLTDDEALYSFRVTATNAVGSSPPSAAAGPFRTAPYAVQDVAVTGGIEHLGLSWHPALATDVTAYVARFRKVGDPTWIVRSVAPTATSASLTTWPVAMPAGTYEVQVGAAHPGTPDPTLWSTSLTATVTALRQRAATSAIVVRPYRDGFQDSVRIAASSNLRTTGSIRILTSHGALVRSIPLVRGTAWATSWTGLVSGRTPCATWSLPRRRPSGRTLGGGDARGAAPRLGALEPGEHAARVALVEHVLPGQGRLPRHPDHPDERLGALDLGVASGPQRRGRVVDVVHPSALSAAAIWGGTSSTHAILPAGTYTLVATARGGEGSAVSTSRSFTIATRH